MGDPTYRQTPHSLAGARDGYCFPVACGSNHPYAKGDVFLLEEMSGATKTVVRVVANDQLGLAVQPVDPLVL